MNINAGANSIGTQVNRYLDSLGLPDSFGDKIGALVDTQKGDLQGALRNIIDLNSGMSTGLLDRLSGARGRRGLGRCHVRRCRSNGPHLNRWSRTYVTRTRVGRQARVGQSYTKARFGGLRIRGRISGRQYRGSFSRPIRLGKSGYLYKGKTYKNMGAIRADLRDGRADGVATRRRTVGGHRLHKHPHFQLGGMIGRLFNPAFNPTQAIQNLFGPQGAAGAAGAQGASGANGAQSASGATGGSAAGSTESVLSNPNMTLEDKLMMLMSKLSDHMDKEIQDKMKEVENAMQKKNDPAKSGGGGGLFGSLGGLFKTAGTAIGTAFGGPIGGMVGSAAGGAIGNAASQATSQASGQASGGGQDGKKPNLQLLQSQLQSLMQKRQQMFQTMQNIMKSLHDTSMAAVRNLKA